MQGICISAMLQSQQTWLPVLHEPKQFENIAIWKSKNGCNYIAHCIDGDKAQLTNQSINQSTLICIGPEGDFTTTEIEAAKKNDFIPVTLGNTRLRTETAGVVAAALLTA
jgi:16S rRNA (uracil1498-N3)-methyltransferase